MASNGRGAVARRALSGALAAAGVALVAKDLRLFQTASYYGSRTALMLILVGGGALLGLVRLRVVAWAALAALALLWLAVAFSPLTARLADGLVRRDPLGPADAVYVLASSVHEDGTLSDEALYRLSHGLELVKQGLAPRLVLGELRPPHAHYAEGARALMAHLGIDTELIPVGPVGDTHDEAVAVAELGRARGWHRVILVTSPLHARRASAAFEHAGLEVVSAPAAEGRYDLMLEDADDRLRCFGDVLHERLGLWLYHRRGWL
jgi:uncharacterized SAM-binding protein YcdF (DUF218 family)